MNGQQYLWRFDYPGAKQLFAYADMVVPVDTTVMLKITSSDAIHSWWIPKLGGKADAEPGHPNETWFKIPEGGRLQGSVRRAVRRQPRRHARLRGRPAGRQYEAWVEKQRKDSSPPSALAAAARPGGNTEARRSRSWQRSRPLPRARRRRYRPEFVTRGYKRRAERLALVADDRRPQAHRDHVHGRRAVFFCIGGVEALIMRPQLAKPENSGLAATLRRPRDDARHHDGLPVRVPIIAAFANYLIPLMIGARDMAFPRLNALSLWLFFAGGIVLYSSLFSSRPGRLDDVRAALGRRLHPDDGADAWILMVHLTGLSTMLGAIDLIATIHNMRAPGMSWRRMPLSPGRSWSTATCL